MVNPIVPITELQDATAAAAHRWASKLTQALDRAGSGSLRRLPLPQHVAEAFQSQLQLTLNEVLANQGERHVELLP
jgi:hypothetical protein